MEINMMIQGDDQLREVPVIEVEKNIDRNYISSNAICVTINSKKIS